MFDYVNIATISLQAFGDANLLYAEMAHGVWGVRYPIERYFSVKIAEAIWQTLLKNAEGDPAVTLEETVQYVYERGEGEADRLPPSRAWLSEFGSDGYIDIVVWEGAFPRVVIEVKRFGRVEADLHRVSMCLRDMPNVGAGIVLFAQSPGEPGTVKNALNNTLNWVQDYIGGEDLRVQSIGTVVQDPEPDLARDNKPRACGFSGVLIRRED